MKKIAIILMVLSLMALVLTGCAPKTAEPAATEAPTAAPADETAAGEAATAAPAENTAELTPVDDTSAANEAAPAAPAVSATTPADAAA